MSTLITFSGMSGAGKTRLAHELLRILEGAFMVPSTTDRKPREDDLPGEYEYLTRSEMADLKARSRGTRKDKIRTLWTIERPNGYSYVTKASAVDEALAREGGYGIMILVPEKVRQLYGYVINEKDSDARIVPLFIKSPGLDVLRTRVSTREQKLADFEAVWPEEKNWEAQTHTIFGGVGFTMIDNPQNENGDVSEAIEAIINRLSFKPARQRIG